MKHILLVFILISGFTFGQFTISDSSEDWQKVGKEVSDVYIATNDNKAKLKIIDFRTRTMGFDPLSTFKTKGQQNVDNLRGEIRKGNEGVKSGGIEFLFKTEPDTIEKLYNLIIDHFDSKKKEVITLTFPEGNIYLDFNSRTAFYTVSFGLDYDGQKIFSGPIVKSQINKIFGKK